MEKYHSSVGKEEKSSADPEGGGDRGSGPPGESHVIWGSMGNKQLDSLPGKSWTPQRQEKVGPPPLP